MKLHHLGIACSDIQETLRQVQSIFRVTGCSEITHDRKQNADLCMVYIEDSLPLELITGPVVQNLVRKGIMLYHTCWEVGDIEATLVRMCDVGWRVISEPKQAILFDSRRVAFLITPVGLVELLEINRDNQ